MFDSYINDKLTAYAWLALAGGVLQAELSGWNKYWCLLTASDEPGTSLFALYESSSAKQPVEVFLLFAGSFAVRKTKKGRKGHP